MGVTECLPNRKPNVDTLTNIVFMGVHFGKISLTCQCFGGFFSDMVLMLDLGKC